MLHSFWAFVTAPPPRLVLLLWLGMASCLPVLWWRKGWLGGGVSLPTTFQDEPRGQEFSNNPEFTHSVRYGEQRTVPPPPPLPPLPVPKQPNKTAAVGREDRPFLHALVQYPYLGDKLRQGKVPVGVNEHRDAHPDEVRRRQGEYHQAMFRTMTHPCVASMHVLLNQTKDLDALYRGLKEEGMKANLTEEECVQLIVFKLSTSVIDRQMTYGDAFSYANRRLGGQYVLLINSDTYPIAEAEGWRRLRPWHFGAKDRTVFMLSRESPACPGRPAFKLPPHPPVPCKRMASWGSADGFVFRGPVPDSVVREMKTFPTNFWGAENRAAAAMKRAGYGPFLNPCEVLRLGHSHCSRVRVTGWNAPRINQGRGRSVVGRFLTQLPGE